MTVALHQRTKRRPPVRRTVAGWKVAAALLVLFWERIWPIALPALAPYFVIAIAGLFGLWTWFPAAHAVALAAAAVISLAALWRWGRAFRLPTRDEALARLEADGRLKHAPLRALEDRPFADGGASPLWRAHIEEMARAAKGARLGSPRPDLDSRDPFSLRYGALGALMIALIAAGPEAGSRLAQSFSFQGAAAASAAADLWIEPPAYTGKAPIYLLREGETVAGLRDQIDAPEGSTVVAQASGRAMLKLQSDKETIEGASDAAEKGRQTLKLDRSGLLTFKASGMEGRWPVGVLADDPPTAFFIEAPEATKEQRVALAVGVEDDYGVASARLVLRLDPDQERPIDAPELDAAALRERRSVDLDELKGKSGDRIVEVDLQEDPWAGLSIYASVVVTDGAGRNGATEEARVTLPSRVFFNPLAKAVIEQRQTLAVAGKDWPRAGRSLDALTLAPDRFYEKSTDYLLMRAAFWRVMRRDPAEGFAKAVEEFWPLALQLEDEALELARQRLEAAQEKLREALERGADDEEVARLVEELRAAMQQYLAALQQSGQRAAEETGEPSQTLEAGDLESMLDQIRDLSQSGARGAARQALSDLENVLRNLRLSGGGGSGEGQSGKGERGGAAGEAGDMIGRQRDLANRSFERGQNGGGGGDLGEEQSGLAGDLGKMLESLQGGEENSDARQALSEALREMREAEQALNSDNFDAAGPAMERAISSLREGAGALAKRDGQAQGADGEARGPATDPLGRPIGEAYGQGVEVPEGFDAQAAREVLEELRRRLSDGKRSPAEIEYLERLLERF